MVCIIPEGKIGRNNRPGPLFAHYPGPWIMERHCPSSSSRAKPAPGTRLAAWPGSRHHGWAAAAINRRTSSGSAPACSNW